MTADGSEGSEGFVGFVGASGDMLLKIHSPSPPEKIKKHVTLLTDKTDKTPSEGRLASVLCVACGDLSSTYLPETTVERDLVCNFCGATGRVIFAWAPRLARRT